MPVPQALVTRYFQLIVSRQFTEAERELERVKQKMQKTEWNRGYFRALYGMYLSRKSGATDDYAFFSKLDLSDTAALHTYRKEFLDHMRNGLHGDFDRGILLSLGRLYANFNTHGNPQTAKWKRQGNSRRKN